MVRLGDGNLGGTKGFEQSGKLTLEQSVEGEVFGSPRAGRLKLFLQGLKCFIYAFSVAVLSGEVLGAVILESNGCFLENPFLCLGIAESSVETELNPTFVAKIVSRGTDGLDLN